MFLLEVCVHVHVRACVCVRIKPSDGGVCGKRYVGYDVSFLWLEKSQDEWTFNNGEIYVDFKILFDDDDQ